MVVSLFIFQSNNGFLIKDIAKYFEMLKEFCTHNRHKFCNKNEIGISRVYLTDLKKDMKKMIEIESKIRQKEEKDRQRKLKKSKQIEQMFREHFLDRHI